MSVRYYIGFSYKTHLFARAIRWFTQSKFSHTYLVQEGPQGLYVLEANFRGVNLQWYPVFEQDGALGIEEYEVHFPEAHLHRAWDVVCKERLNRPYSYMQIVGDAVVIAGQKLLGRSLPNPFSQRKADVCSELVLAWIKAAGIPGYEAFDEATVTPEDLLQVIQANQEPSAGL